MIKYKITIFTQFLIIIGLIYYFIDVNFTLGKRNSHLRTDLFVRSNKLIAASKLSNYFINGKTKDEMRDIIIDVFPDKEIDESFDNIGYIWLNIKVVNDTIDQVVVDEMTEWYATRPKDRK